MRQEQGMTLIGMILTLAIVVIAGIVILKVVPVYIEYFAVHRSVSSLNRIPASELSVDKVASVQFLHKKLKNQLYVNGIEIPSQKIKIKPLNDGQFNVSIKYDVVKHIVGHVNLLFEFDVSKEVKPSGE